MFLASIVYKPEDVTPAPEDYTRIPLQTAQLVAGKGIDGDTKGSPNRQLNIMSVQTVEELGTEGFKTAPGQLGEQLLISGLDVNVLPIGTRLQIGEHAHVELTEPRTGCAKLEKYHSRQRQEAAGRLGMMARVLVGGTVTVGDPVCVLDSSSNTE